MEKNCLCCIWKVHKSKITEVDELKHYQIKSNHEELISFSKIKKIYLTTLTPSRACLEEHINLANYQVPSTYLETSKRHIYGLPEPWTENITDKDINLVLSETGLIF